MATWKPFIPPDPSADAHLAGKREAVALVRGWMDANRRVNDHSARGTARLALLLDLEELLDGIS